MTDLTFAALRSANNLRQKQWEAGATFTIEYLGCALAGEVGEACNVIKKMARERLGAVGSRANITDLAEELADAVIYVDLIARKADIDLAEAIRAKFNQTSEKYDLGARL
jgi:NTP pyrophosphatase (non-canonical NTP hydrolase)